MAEFGLAKNTPLGGEWCQSDKIGEVRITEKNDFALASISQRRDQEKAFTATTKIVFKTMMPRAGKWMTSGDYMVFWSAPDQWFVEAPESSHEKLASLLKKNYTDSASVTEQSGGWCKFELEGDSCITLLQRLCMADIEGMLSDMVVRTAIDHVGVIMVCVEPHKRYSVYGPRSYAQSLHHAIMTAARSIA